MSPLFLLLASLQLTSALDVDVNSPESIKAAAKAVAANLLSYYHGDQPGKTPGILDGPPPAGAYYWWQGGAMWGGLIDYWRTTGDATWNDATRYALLFQGVNAFQDDNWTVSLGNDDQGFWGMSALLAAESRLPDPSPALLRDMGRTEGYLALAQGVFNTQAAPDRHDGVCGGGLHWQIPPTNVGYDYKNTISNGIFFNMGARLARYTDNTTYSDWAVRQWDWMQAVGVIDDEYNVYDGGHVEDNCRVITKTQFSYCAGVVLEGAAFMYNYTDGSDLWATRVQGLVNRTLTYFFPDGIMIEPSCELPTTTQCDTDQLSFKGYVHRWLATTAQVAPLVAAPIAAALQTSAAAAAAACAADGVPNGQGVSTATCGFRWTAGRYDGGPPGAGQQMNVLGALTAVLAVLDAAAAGGPVTNATGGTSVADPGAGGEARAARTLRPVAVGDRAGAGLVTVVMLVVLAAGTWWMSF